MFQERVKTYLFPPASPAHLPLKEMQIEADSPLKVVLPLDSLRTYPVVGLFILE